MNFDWTSFWHYLFQPTSVYLHGLWLTLSLSVVSQGFGTVIGVAAALGTQSRFRAVRALVAFYTWLLRGTPLLVQLVFIYTAIEAHSHNEDANKTENNRAGNHTDEGGQTEAAKSRGMTYFKYMRRIILP